MQAGFKFGANGPHISRTMMLDEISQCLDRLPREAERCAYRDAIIADNILGKQTEATRKESFRRLRELYALDPGAPLFTVLRPLDSLDRGSRPLLCLLLACARDPLLRVTLPPTSIHDDQELNAWLDGVRKTVNDKLEEGPVILP